MKNVKINLVMPLNECIFINGDGSTIYFIVGKTVVLFVYDRTCIPSLVGVGK